MPCWTRQVWPRNLNQTVSGKPGAVHLLNRVALFVGYSFGDVNIGLLFDQLNELLKTLPDSDTGKRAYIVVNNPSDFEYTLFQKRNIEIIPTYGDKRSETLVEVLEEIVT